MKSVFITFDQAFYERILALLDRQNCRGTVYAVEAMRLADAPLRFPVTQIPPSGRLHTVYII